MTVMASTSKCFATSWVPGASPASEANHPFECSLCFEQYDEGRLCPRMLGCGHTFCTSCLEILLKDSFIECPNDRIKMNVQANVQSLPKNFALMGAVAVKRRKLDSKPLETPCEVCDEKTHFAQAYCKDCGQAMCLKMANTHSKLRVSRFHTVVPVARLRELYSVASSFCTEHSQPYRYFDSDCKLVLCVDCFALNHSGHRCVDSSAAATNCRAEVMGVCDEARTRACEIKETRKVIEDVLYNLRQHYREASDAVDNTFEQVSSSLLDRKEDIHLLLGLNYKRKSAALRQQIDQLEGIETCLATSVRRANDALQSENDNAFLWAYCDVEKTKIMSHIATDVRPAVDDLLEFTADTWTFINVISTFGSVRD